MWPAPVRWHGPNLMHGGLVGHGWDGRRSGLGLRPHLSRLQGAGLDLDRLIVREGLAWAFRKYSEDHVDAEDLARAAGIAIWEQERERERERATPWDYRRDRWNVALSDQDFPIPRRNTANAFARSQRRLAYLKSYGTGIAAQVGSLRDETQARLLRMLQSMPPTPTRASRRGSTTGSNWKLRAEWRPSAQPTENAGGTPARERGGERTSPISAKSLKRWRARRDSNS
jgi:hypothetical protein